MLPSAMILFTCNVAPCIGDVLLGILNSLEVHLLAATGTRAPATDVMCPKDNGICTEASREWFHILKEGSIVLMRALPAAQICIVIRGI
jgi:hypothetical protein